MESSAASQLKYAGFWLRAWATIIDTLLMALILAPLLLAIYGKEYFSNDDIFAGPADFLLQVVVPAIAVITFWIYKRATPGKMAIRATIVDARTGKAPSNGQLIGRYLGYYVSILPLGLGFIWVAFDAKKQGFHDKLAGTVVVREQRETSDSAVFEPGA